MKPLILHIETSGKACSVALSEGQELLAEKKISEDRSHAKSLTVMIQDILKSTAKKPDAVAVSAGPGSYTGLRIGVSVAKAMCYASDIPLIAVPTLEIMFNHFRHHAEHYQMVNDQADYFVPMIDARRMEVYQMIFSSSGEVIEPVKPKIIDENSYQDELNNHELVIFGNGSRKCQDVIHHENAMFVEGIDPEAKHMISTALSKYEAKDFEDVAYYEPFYLKAFMATKPKNLLF
jgi:tRNA threonylcarbamoyladenosine biosynthesis protein TsaB